MKKYLLCLLVCVACSKENYNFKQVFAPAFKDQKETEVTKSSATLSITLVQDYNSMVSKRGFYYATSKEALANVGERRVATDPSFGTGSYTVQLKHLIPETTYYYQAFATNGQGTALADIQSFTTLKGTACLRGRDGGSCQCHQYLRPCQGQSSPYRRGSHLPDRLCL